MRQRCRTTGWALCALLLAVAILSTWTIRPDPPGQAPQSAGPSTAAGSCPGPEHRPDATTGMRPCCSDGYPVMHATLTRGIYTPRTVPCQIRGSELPAHSRPAPHIQPRPA